MHQRFTGIIVLAVFVLAAAIAVPEARSDSNSETSNGGIIYKPAPEATLKYPDGVVVHRHADGTVEVTDPDSMESSYQATRPVRRAVRNKSVSRKTVKLKQK